MGTFSFRPAIREEVGLLIGLMGGTGSGKTFSALRLATGIVGQDKPFALIDTESRRALHYAPPPGQEPDFKDTFRFDHAELGAPFRPEAYLEAIKAADAAGYKVIVVDSASHSWAGEGGVLDWQEEELTRMAGDDWKKREACKMAAWIKPKMSHKKMMQGLLQVRATLILCFRAEEKVEMTRDDKGKMVIQQKQGMTGRDGWFPICEKNLPFELMASFLLLASKPGFPLPLKLEEQHKALFPLDKPLGEESGRLIAEWAAGAKKPSLLESAKEEFSKIDNLVHLANHWKKHATAYRADPDFAKITETKDTRKAELSKALDMAFLKEAVSAFSRSESLEALETWLAANEKRIGLSSHAKGILEEAASAKARFA